MRSTWGLGGTYEQWSLLPSTPLFTPSLSPGGDSAPGRESPSLLENPVPYTRKISIFRRGSNLYRVSPRAGILTGGWKKRN